MGLKQLEEFLEISPEISEENFFFNATKVCLSIKKGNLSHFSGFLLWASADDGAHPIPTCLDLHQVTNVTKIVYQFGHKLISAHLHILAQFVSEIGQLLCTQPQKAACFFNGFS